MAAIAGLASLLTLPDLEFDFNPLNLKDPSVGIGHDVPGLEADPENSPNVIDILAPSLAEADRIARDLAANPLVGRTVTLSSFVPEAQDEKLDLIESLAWSIGPLLQSGEAEPLSASERVQALERLRTTLAEALAGDLTAERNPGAAALAEALSGFASANADDAARAELEARLLGLLPALLDDLRQALEAGPVGQDDLPDEVRDRWLTPDGQARVMVQPAGQIDGNGELQAFAEAVLAEVPHATGAPILVLEGGSAVVDAFIQASVLALVLITLLLAVFLRSVRDILLVLAPIVLAGLLTFASAVLLGQSLNFANVIALPLLLGLGVSGAIHVVVRQRQHGDVAAHQHAARGGVQQADHDRLVRLAGRVRSSGPRQHGTAPDDRDPVEPDLHPGRSAGLLMVTSGQRRAHRGAGQRIRPDDHAGDRRHRLRRLGGGACAAGARRAGSGAGPRRQHSPHLRNLPSRPWSATSSEPSSLAPRSPAAGRSSTSPPTTASGRREPGTMYRDQRRRHARAAARCRARPGVERIVYTSSVATLGLRPPAAPPTRPRPSSSTT